jgi:hypothetical protein
MGTPDVYSNTAGGYKSIKKYWLKRRKMVFLQKKKVKTLFFLLLNIAILKA